MSDRWMNDMSLWEERKERIRFVVVVIVVVVVEGFKKTRGSNDVSMAKRNW